MMTDYTQLYDFVNFVEQHLVLYEYASISLVAIETSMWLLYTPVEGDFIA